MKKSEFYNNLTVMTDEEKAILNGPLDIDRKIYMQDEKNIINSKKLLKSGRIITIHRHPRFVHFPEHTHDFVEVVYMVMGKTTHIVNGDIVELGKGEFLFLSQNARQEILPAGEDDIAVNFVILPQFFNLSLEMLGNEETPLKKFITECLKGNESHIGYLHFKVSDVLTVQNLAENLIWTLVNDVLNKRKINEMTMGLLFLHLLNHTDKLEFTEEENNFALSVLQYVEEHYLDGSLTELSEILYYDINALSKAIKGKLGRNFTDIVQEKRLSQACFLLKNTNIKVDEIADKVGYSNISYFYRLFKRVYGCSPFAYRKANKDSFLDK